MGKEERARGRGERREPRGRLSGKPVEDRRQNV